MARSPENVNTGKYLTALLLALSLVSVIIVLGFVATWQNLNIVGDLGNVPFYDYESVFGWQSENGQTSANIVDTALIAGLAAVGSYIVGIHYVRVWTTESASAAQAAAWVAFGLLLLPFSYVWKEIALGGHRGDKVIVIEAFVIILTFVHFVYTVYLYAHA